MVEVAGESPTSPGWRVKYQGAAGESPAPSEIREGSKLLPFFYSPGVTARWDVATGNVENERD